MKNLALLTDLYELTMMQGYYFQHIHREAVFDMFFRRHPYKGGFTIFAGLEPLVDAIVNLRFTGEEIHYLDGLKLFDSQFLDYLKDFRFQGDIYALQEGSIVYPNEPLLRVHGTLIETQLVESMVLNFINFQSLIATKAARLMITSNGGDILEFGLRRAQGIDGALSAARAAFIGGAAATSNVLAGKTFGIPVRGTMAHSWVMSFPSELQSFEKFAELYPNNCILLVDTYDTLNSGIPNAIIVFKKLKEKGIHSFGIRMDSGDLEYLSKKARSIFDENNLHEAKIVVSNELDEWVINELIKENAPIDSWGVGTKLVTGDQDPALTGVYKIVATQNGDRFDACMKITNNPEKMSNPGIKNILRFYDANGLMIADLIYLEEDENELMEMVAENKAIRFNHPTIDYSFFFLSGYTRANKLLHPVIFKGEKILPSKSLQEIQQFNRQQINTLDKSYKRLLNPHLYKISLSDNLKNLKTRLIQNYLGGNK